LEIQAGLLISSGIAPGQMRSDHVNLLIVALGVLGSAVTGTAGAILIERIAPKQANLALAELILAFAAAFVIAAYGTYGMAWGRDRRGQSGSAAGRPSINRAAARAARGENV
jgi:CBS domain containing-hemolysin-like protein